YLCGERITTTTFFSVGSGTGPTTVAPARVTVSTILRAEASRPAWSYDFSRMRIFCPAMSISLFCTHRRPQGPLYPRCSSVNPRRAHRRTAPAEVRRVGFELKLVLLPAAQLRRGLAAPELCTALAVTQASARDVEPQKLATPLHSVQAGRVALLMRRRRHSRIATSGPDYA